MTIWPNKSIEKRITDYDQMKDKLIVEVVSAELNADMLDKVPHKEYN